MSSLDLPLVLPSAKPTAWATRLLRGVGCTWVGLACAIGLVRAEPHVPMPSPDEAKAVHLHRFSGFVEWPAESFSSPDAPIVVGVVGAPGVQRELSQVVAGRLVQGRGIQVLELAEPRQARRVHMLMIGSGAWGRADEWVAGAKGQRVLVVTDMPRGLEHGAAVCFVDADTRLRFEASVPAADAAGVRLSSRLLALAERVVRGP